MLAHSDVAPGRKIDPGEKFPWEGLAAAGVGHYVPPAADGRGRFIAGATAEPLSSALQSMLRALRLWRRDIGIFDPDSAIVVDAFQRHFRPARVDGVADGSTIDTLHRLLEALARRVG